MKKEVILSEEQVLERFCRQEGMLRAYLICCGIESQDLDDVVQDVFLTVWQKADSLRNPDSFEAWVRTIAKRKAAEYLRKRNRYWKRNCFCSSFEEACQKGELYFRSEPVYGGGVSFAESELYGLIAGLGIPASEILLLHYVSGETYEEISQTLHMPAGTVRSIACRSRKKLKKTILEKKVYEGAKIY